LESIPKKSLNGQRVDSVLCIAKNTLRDLGFSNYMISQIFLSTFKFQQSMCTRKMDCLLLILSSTIIYLEFAD
jgi:hypothetical protein